MIIFYCNSLLKLTDIKNVNKIWKGRIWQCKNKNYESKKRTITLTFYKISFIPEKFIYKKSKITEEFTLICLCSV